MSAPEVVLEPAAQWITRYGAEHDLDPDRMAVAGESVGGNKTAALALMAKERGDVHFVHHSMYYPVTDAAMDTPLRDTRAATAQAAATLRAAFATG